MSSPPKEEKSPSDSNDHEGRPAPRKAPESLSLDTIAASEPQGENTPAASQGAFVATGPFSSYSVGSDNQLGHPSTASDISTDRVFPIRSVISVDPSRSGDEAFSPHPSDTESRDGGRGTSTSMLGSPQEESSSDQKWPDLGGFRSPTSPTPGDRLGMMRRKRTLSSPYSNPPSSPRRGSTAPLDLEFPTSEHGSEEAQAPQLEDKAPGDAGSSVQSDTQSLSGVAHLTTRFTHVETEDGHAIITGRDENLQQCEDEPIHTPGAVQGFGAMLAMREDDNGNFVVRYVSENSLRLLGYSPKQLFRMKSFLDVLTEEQQDNLLDHIDFIRDEDADPGVNGPELLSLSIRAPKQRKTIKLWCAIHINAAHPDLIICEFELDDDEKFPLRPPDEVTPDTPYDTLGSNPTREELEQSTEVLSRPLRILRSARRRRGEQGAMQVFDIMSQVQEQLAAAENLDAFLKVLVGIVKELTGFHRIMIYQFDSTFNGKVVTELVDTSHTVDLYKGLHFPASDIPRQARDLYKINKVRLLYDRDLQTARIVCRTQEDLDVPLDMTHAYLRAMSPIHLKYLAHMEVRSSMSVSINAFNELWGLISCHGYGDHGMRVSFPIRKMCRLIGESASRNIERLSYASRLQARKLINTAPTNKNPSGYIIASSDDLLRLFDADFGLLSITGETKILGNMEHSQEALALLEYLRMRKLTSVVATQDVAQDFPDLRYPPGFHGVAGLLYVPLSVGGSDFIVFFRKGQVKEVKWAGNPYQKKLREGTAGYLEPRSSFQVWRETVVGRCREWGEEQIETAAVLCLVYGKFIEVWRQKEAALQSSKLTRLLLANSAHEVRTPLNAIINYLEIALEGSLDQETRENLAKSHSASKSLIYVINDLLDLTKTEEGQNLIKDEVFELSSCIKEATEPFSADAHRKGIEYNIVEDPGLPQRVHGDSRRVRQAISNLTANALSHTNNGYVKVEAFVSEITGRQVKVEFVISDSGSGMSSSQVDSLFRDLEQVIVEDAEATETEDTAKPQDMQTLGLGLAVVARIVKNMDGQLRVKSELDQGSRFVIQLPFQLADDSPESLQDDNGSSSQATFQSNHVTSAPANLRAAPAGEVMLMNRASATNLNTDGRSSRSAESRRSLTSVGSQDSHKSDADRLIHAIQTPLSLTEKDSDYFTSRSKNRGNTSVHSFSNISQTVESGSPPSKSLNPPSPTKSKDSAGTASVRDSKMPVRAIKVPDELEEQPAHPQTGQQSRVLFELPSDSQQASSKATSASDTSKTHSLKALVAEDDPINMKIVSKRLQKTGHSVTPTVNGQDCATVFLDKSSTFDVVLMDMQMPIVDGLTSTKMIRSFENSDAHGRHSKLASRNSRVPIFAVSASLVEEERQTYIDAGFDGWILKPIDFKRLNTLLSGIYDDQVRESCLYVPGEWERGGWFTARDGADSGSSDEPTPMPTDAGESAIRSSSK